MGARGDHGSQQETSSRLSSSRSLAPFAHSDPVTWCAKCYASIYDHTHTYTYTTYTERERERGRHAEMYKARFCFFLFFFTATGNFPLWVQAYDFAEFCFLHQPTQTDLSFRMDVYLHPLMQCNPFAFQGRRHITSTVSTSTIRVSPVLKQHFSLTNKDWKKKHTFAASSDLQDFHCFVSMCWLRGFTQQLLKRVQWKTWSLRPMRGMLFCLFM